MDLASLIRSIRPLATSLVTNASSTRSHGDDIATVRLEDERRRDLVVPERLGQSARILRSHHHIPESIGEAVLKDACASTWGTVYPMREQEVKLHKNVFAGITGEGGDPTTQPFRPMYQLCESVLSRCVVVRVMLLHPLLASSTIVCPSGMTTAIAKRIIDSRLEIVTMPSSDSNGIAVADEGGTLAVKGRYSLLASSVYCEEYDLDDPKIMMVNMSCAPILVLISYQGTTWQCCLTSLSLNALYNTRVDSTVDMSFQRLSIRGVRMGGTTSGHIKVSDNGHCTYVGSPSDISPTFKSMSVMFNRVMKDISLASHFIRSLDVISEIGSSRK